MSIEGNP